MVDNNLNKIKKKMNKTKLSYPYLYGYELTYKRAKSKTSVSHIIGLTFTNNKSQGSNSYKC